MLVGISVVKNEADIVEAMIRLNLRFLDHIHVIDNGSSDSTFAILEHLKRELPSLSVARDLTAGHPQTELMNRFLAECAASYDPKHVIPLDGDEIIIGDPEAFRAELKECDDPIELPWRTYVPTEHDDTKLTCPVQRIRWRRVIERPLYSKTSIPRRLLAGAVWSQGSHKILVGGKGVPALKSKSVVLAHFPVRSIEQITAKALIGHWGLSLRGAPPREGKQWHEISHELMMTGTLSQKTFLQIGRTYAAGNSEDIIEDPVHIPAEISMGSMEQSATNALRRVVSFTEDLVHEFRKAEERARHKEKKDAIVRVIRPGHIPKPSRLVRATVRERDVEFCVTHPSDEIQKHHLRGQFYEKEELEIIGRYFQRGGVFFDIGANVGNHAVYCALFLEPRQIILAEPNPDAIRTLAANIQLNGLEGICDLTGLGVGIGNVSTNSAAIEWRRNKWQETNLGGASLRSTGGELEIKKGDDFLGTREVDFIKIDVEGMEISVLESLTETLARCRPTLFVEVDNMNADAFSSWLNENHYVVRVEYSRYRRNCNYLCEPASSFT